MASSDGHYISRAASPTELVEIEQVQSEPYALFPGTYHIENAESSSQASIHAQLSYGQWSGSPVNWYSQPPPDKSTSTPSSPVDYSLTPARTPESLAESHRTQRRAFSTNARIIKAERKSKSPQITSIPKRIGVTNMPIPPSWRKSILVRLKSSTDQPDQDLRYTMVRLPSSDMSSCISAICTKMNLVYIIGMPISWLDSRTMSRGPFDQDYLQNIPDMQDFVIDLIKVGWDDCVELLFEI